MVSIFINLITKIIQNFSLLVTLKRNSKFFFTLFIYILYSLSATFYLYPKSYHSTSTIKYIATYKVESNNHSIYCVMLSKDDLETELSFVVAMMEHTKERNVLHYIPMPKEDGRQ